MNHDPLCHEQVERFTAYGLVCDDCNLIARVRETWYEAQSETWEKGYAAGLDAARDAVAAERYMHLIDADTALAAIDALREEEK